MFQYHDKESAPKRSKELLDQSKKAFGMIPNLHRILAEAPITYEIYNTSFDLFMKNSSPSPVEQQVVFMTANLKITVTTVFLDTPG